MGNSASMLTFEEYMTLKRLKKRIWAEKNENSGVISIVAEFPDPNIAASVAEKAMSGLKEYVTNYRLGKSLRILEFMSSQTEKAKLEFEKAQNNLANFRDANKNIVSAKIQSEEERLQSQYNLAFNLFNGLSQQLEQSRLNVQQETPIFKVLDPVYIPYEKSRPKRSMILIFSIFLGIIFGSGYFLLKDWFSSSPEKA